MARTRNQAHRSGAVVMRGVEKRPTEDQQLLQEAVDTSFVKTDTWRALRIMGEFVEGFDALAGIGPAVSVFGSARIGPGDPSYRQARMLTRKLAKRGYAIITNETVLGDISVAASVTDEHGRAIAGISISVPAGNPGAIIPVTGLSAPGSELYGGHYISHLQVNSGTTNTFPLQ